MQRTEFKALNRWSLVGLGLLALMISHLLWNELDRTVVSTDRLLAIHMLVTLIVVGILFAGVERSELRRLDGAQRRNRHLSLALDAAPVAILLADARQPGYPTLYCNRAFCEMTGYGEAEIVGRDRSFLNGADTDTREFDRLDHALRQARPITLELLRYRRSGAPYWNQITVAPVLDGDGCPDLFIAIEQDVTERRRTAELRAQSKKLEALGQLAGGVAHDFNNVLGIIDGHTRLALCKTGEERHTRHLEVIRAAVERGAVLTRQLLAFGRKDMPKPGAHDLIGLIRAQDRILASALTPMVQLGVNLPSSEDPIMVKCEPELVGQMILNLVVNARDAMPAEGRIELRLEVVEASPPAASGHEAGPSVQYARLTVKDDGHGIPIEIQDRVFEPFFTTKPAGAGTGLGLSMVYGTMLQFGGWALLSSRPGAGTCVQLYFPLARMAAEPVLPVPEALPIRGLTILVVDDEPDLLDALRERLCDLGATVLTASDVRDAMATAICWDGQLDLVLTDIIMPGGTGAELAKMLSQRWPELPCIFMTGHGARAGMHQTALPDGALILPKPIDFDRIEYHLAASLTGGECRAEIPPVPLAREQAA